MKRRLQVVIGGVVTIVLLFAWSIWVQSSVTHSVGGVVFLIVVALIILAAGWWTWRRFRGAGGPASRSRT